MVTNLGANVTTDATQSYGNRINRERDFRRQRSRLRTPTADAVADGDGALTVATGSAQFEGAVGGTNTLGNIGVATTLTVTNTGSLVSAVISATDASQAR